MGKGRSVYKFHRILGKIRNANRCVEVQSRAPSTLSILANELVLTSGWRGAKRGAIFRGTAWGLLAPSLSVGLGWGGVVW